MNDRPKLLGDRYEVGGLLGHGGMAEVYLGRDRRLGRSVAIKVLKPELSKDDTFLARFQQEAQSAAGLNHPSIVSVYDSGEGEILDTAGEEHPVPYIIMEYVEGQTLREIIHADGGLPVRECSEIMAGVLSALDYSHRMGIVHRDIKPANIMLTTDGSVKVMDFGIARAMDGTANSMTQTQAIVGTANYFSPEQAKGEVVDARSDLYSAACVMFELLTGRAPFVGDSPIAVAYQHVREQPLPPSEFNVNISESLDRVLLKGLTKHRDDRYSSAREFALDLRAAISGQAVGAPFVNRDELATSATQAIPEATLVHARNNLGHVAAMSAAPQADPSTGRTYNQARGTSFTDLVSRPETGAMPAVAAEPKQPNRAAIAVLLVGFVVLLGAGLVWGYSKNLLPFQTQTTVVAAYSADSPQSFVVVDKRLKDAGLKTVRVDETSATVSNGNVIALDPTGGSTVAVGSTVKVTVSSGPPAPVTVAVPDVTNKTLEVARKALSDAKLNFGTVKFEDSTEVDSGNVIRTEPSNGTAVKEGDSIVLVVASGNQKLIDVRQLAQAEAEKKLQDMGFVPKVETQETSTVQAGIVFQQQPEVDTSLPKGSTVTITVAIAPTQALIKDYTGKDGTATQDELLGLGLKPVLVPTSSDTVKAGLVIATDPAGGNTVKVGTQVVVKVSSGPARVTLKNYAGISPSDASADLTALGLKAQIVTQSEYSSTAANGTVSRTDPVTGTQVAVGSVVNLFISAGPQPAATPTTTTTSATTSVSVPPSLVPVIPTPVGSVPTTPSN